MRTLSPDFQDAVTLLAWGHLGNTLEATSYNRAALTVGPHEVIGHRYDEGEYPGGGTVAFKWTETNGSLVSVDYRGKLVAIKPLFIPMTIGGSASAICGAWPGDETEEELVEALKEMS